MAGRFADGAWLAELAAVRDPAQVAAVVAAALGIPEQPGVPAAGALARVLAGQQLLLVLDNCEHVIGAAARLCAERVGAAGLARARDAGDLRNQALLLIGIVDVDLRAGRTGDAAAHLREALRLAVRTGNWFDLRIGLFQCGDLCAATGRGAEALTLWAARAAVDRREGRTYPSLLETRREERQRQARQALGPGRAREAEERGAAMSLATAAEYALMLTDPGPPQLAAPGSGHAQRPGTGAGQAGRPGPDQRADRRRAAHQRPHRRLAPGPDPGQDRLPPPRRPDPPGPHRTPGLARPRPTPVPVGRLTPAAAATQKGSADLCPVHRPADQTATDRLETSGGYARYFP